jgi:DUF917 family protein
MKNSYRINMFEISNMKEIENLVSGATFLGTGGGGDPKAGLKNLKEIIDSGKKIKIVTIDEAPKNSIIVVPYNVGSIAPIKKLTKSVKFTNPLEIAIKQMEEIVGLKIGAVVSSEIGGSNTPAALSMGSKLNIPAIDGDLVGRAAPELHQCTCHIFDIKMYPSVIVSERGNIIIVKEYTNIDDYESIARYMSVLEGDFVAVVDTPMDIDNAKKAIIPKTVSLAINVGEIINNENYSKSEKIDKLTNLINGWKIFEGIVDKFVWKNEGGFLKGEILIKGENEYKGKILRSWIMNEHILVFIDDKPVVICPDSFTLTDENLNPITNSQLKEGMKVIGFAFKSPDIWRSKKGLQFFGPRHFGFNFDYVPVEELLK